MHMHILLMYNVILILIAIYPDISRQHIGGVMVTVFASREVGSNQRFKLVFVAPPLSTLSRIMCQSGALCNHDKAK